MPEMPITLIKGDRVSKNVDYRDSLPVNVSGVLREMLGAKGFMLQEPGLTAIGIGSGKDRGGIWNERRKQHFRVSGTNLISVAQNGTTEVLGTIDGTDPVSMPYSFNSQAIIGGGKMYLFEAGTVTEVTDPNLRRPLDAVWVDGYYFLTDGEYLYHTQLADESAIDPLDFATAEFSPDQTVGLGLTMDNKVIVFGRYTIEYFVNAAESEFAFTRLPTRAVKYGLVGTHAKCEIGGQFYFLGNPKESNVTVYALGVGSVEEIASREVAKLISQYSEEQLESVVMEARVIDDYTYIILHLPEETLLFNQNIAAGVGKDFAWSIIKSSTHLNRPYRGIHGVYDPRRSEWVYGDKWSSTIGFLDEETATHYGEPVECIIYTPFVYLEHQSIDELEIFMIPGFYTPNWPFAARISGVPSWPGGPDGFSTVVADPSRAIADGEAIVLLTMTVRDTNDQPVTGLVADDFEFQGIGNADPETFTDTGDGVYTQSFTSESQTELSITVRVQGVNIGTVGVEFYAVGVMYGWGTDIEAFGTVSGNTYGVPALQSGADLWFDIGVSSGYASAGSGASVTLPRSSVLGLSDNGRLYGHGYNWRGALALGDAFLQVRVDDFLENTLGGVDWRKVVGGAYSAASSDNFTLALKENGELYGSGYNGQGELAQGAANNVNSEFIQITGEWSDVFAGAQSAIGINSSGEAFAWGDNEYGQLGVNSHFNNQLSPVSIGTGISYAAFGGQGTSNAKRMSAIIQNGDLYTAGIQPDSRLQLGYDNTSGEGTSYPIGTIYDEFKAVGLSGCVTVSISVNETELVPSHTVVLKEDGTVWGFGGNDAGQLGQGDTDDRTTPVQIGDEDDWNQAVATSRAIFLLKNDGRIFWCGQFPGTSHNRSTLQRAPFTNWLLIEPGINILLALRDEIDPIFGDYAFDLSDAVSAGSLESLFGATGPIDFKWINDGTQFAFTDADGVYVANVTTAYDVTTYDGGGVQNSFEDGDSPKVSFSPDGTIMIYGRDTDVIETHGLGTPWDVSTQYQLSSATYGGSDGYHAIDANGQWLIVKRLINAVNETYDYRLWELSVRWDIAKEATDTGESYNVSALPGGDSDDIGAIEWSPDGNKLYWVSNDTGVVRSATMNGPFDVDTAADDGVSLGDGSVVNATLRFDAPRLYLSGGGEVEQFDE